MHTASFRVLRGTRQFVQVDPVDLELESAPFRVSFPLRIQQCQQLPCPRTTRHRFATYDFTALGRSAADQQRMGEMVDDAMQMADDDLRAAMNAYFQARRDGNLEVHLAGLSDWQRTIVLETAETFVDAGRPGGGRARWRASGGRGERAELGGRILRG